MGLLGGEKVRRLKIRGIMVQLDEDATDLQDWVDDAIAMTLEEERKAAVNIAYMRSKPDLGAMPEQRKKRGN